MKLHGAKADIDARDRKGEIEDVDGYVGIDINETTLIGDSILETLLQI